jgi:FAD/FMN-containing dehydrogenase
MYQERIVSYWSLSSQLHPHCFVQPTSTNDVVKIVNTLVKHPACTETEFAVRAGGHMPWASSNNIDNGITIDLGLMNSTMLNKTSLIASLQPGARWGSVYGTLEPFGYTVAGGRAHDVGVGGFIMGGGNTFFANRYGFGVDNVNNFEVVLASGCVLHFPTITLIKLLS